MPRELDILSERIMNAVEDFGKQGYKVVDNRLELTKCIHCDGTGQIQHTGHTGLVQVFECQACRGCGEIGKLTIICLDVTPREMVVDVKIEGLTGD